MNTRTMPSGTMLQRCLRLLSLSISGFAFSCGGVDSIDQEGPSRASLEPGNAGETSASQHGKTSAQTEIVVVETQLGDPQSVEERWSALVGVVGERTAEMLWLDETDPSVAVYELQLENGNTVSWTEVKRGKVAISEVGPAAPSVPLDLATSGASAAEVFLIVAPDLPVPKAIEELSHRQREMADIHLTLALAQDDFPELVHAPGWEVPSETSDAADLLTPNVQRGEVGQLRSPLSDAGCFAGTNCGSCPTSNDWAVTQMNKTSNSTISRSDQETVVSLGCTQTGQITHSVRYYDWWWEGWVTWFSFDLVAGWHTSTQLLQLDGGAEDFDVEVRMRDFATGDKGSQCACGWND